MTHKCPVSTTNKFWTGIDASKNLLRLAETWCKCDSQSDLVPVSSYRCLPPIPMRTMTDAMKMWIQWQRLLSMSWRKEWRGWTYSLWSWRKVSELNPVFFLTSRVFIQILSVKSALYFGHINNSKHLLYFDLPEASLHLAKKENTKNPQM